MGSCVSVQCNLCPNVNLNCSLEEIRGICWPESKVDILTEKMANLRALRMDVEGEIKGKLNSQVAVRNEVKTWLENVDELGKAVSTIVAPHPANRLLSCCYVCSDYKLDIDSKIGRVEEMIKQKSDWKDSILMEKPKTYALECLPTNIMGMEQVVSQVLHYLDDEKVRVIGIHGMGGVGKTTLAKQVIKILDSSAAGGGGGDKEMVKFDVIIWAAVSQNRDTRKLQEDIAVELGLHESSEFKHKDESIRARFLSKYLSVRRFLLVLDDVWKQFDLTSIGIPELQEDLGNKIVLTTREEKVCTDMGARKSTVKVDCLGRQESWELFRRKIQWDENEFKERGIYQIAQDIACKCRGLPLVLVTIARAMATKSDISLWRHAADLLNESPNEIEGIEDVYKLLEFSYDNLKKEEYKSCLLYSALFPEDEEINIETIAGYCIGGGYVSADCNVSHRTNIRLRGHGRLMISELIDACLLERGKDEEHVKVHDVVRDMILNWIGGGNRGSRCKILSRAGKGLRGTHDVDLEEWQAASMLSLQRNDIRGLAIKEENRRNRQSSNLQVLLLNFNRRVKNFPPSLFEYFPNLQVLDVSGTDIEEIPASLCLLNSLRYLNLSDTNLKALPKEMGNLRNLMQLDLLMTGELCEIPSGIFSSLSKIQYLDLLHCDFFKSYVAPKEKLQVLKEIGDLHLLKDVRLCFSGDVDAFKFSVDESDPLSNSITKLWIEQLGSFKRDPFKWMGSRLRKLELLHISSVEEDRSAVDGDEEDLVIDDGQFSELKELLIRWRFDHIILKGRALEHLTRLRIGCCDELRDLTFLWKLPSLKSLHIQLCKKIVELMGPLPPEGDGTIHHRQNYQPFLTKVEDIALWGCPNFLRISTSSLRLHSLKKLKIGLCPLLKDISMIDSPHKVEVHCQKEWWEDLRWETSGGVPLPNFIPVL